MHHAVERFLMDGSACIPHNCTDVGDQLMLLLTTGKKRIRQNDGADVFETVCCLFR